MKTYAVLAAGATLPALVALIAPRDQIEFRVADGVELTKTFELRSEMSQDSMSMTMNGQEAGIGEVEMNMVSEELTTVTDAYSGGGAGRPGKLQRTFDKLSSHTSVSVKSPMGDEDKEFTGSSKLEGLTVLFTLGEDQEYQVAFGEGSTGDDELLEELWEDMDLRTLLPDGAVSSGDSWKLDEALLQHLLAPGGNMKVVPESSDGGGGFGGGAQPGLSDMLGDIKAQEATATYAGTEERDGTRVGLIKIKLVKLSSAKDITEFMQGSVTSEELPEGVEISVDSADAEIELDAEGELAWDLAGGHMRSFELSGTMSMALDVSMDVSMQGQNMSMENSMEFSGSFTRSVKLGASE